MTTGRRHPSLMDDSEFLAELEQRQGTDPDRAADDQSHSRMTPRGWGLPNMISDLGSHSEAWTTGAHPYEDEPEPDDYVPDRPSRGRIALAIGGFLLMMGLGAAAAALVFRDRVAQLFGW